MKCFICQIELKPFITNKNFKILRCPSCGLGVTQNPKVQKKDYHRDEEYFEEENLFKNIFQRRVRIISEFVKTGSVLEVGCSTGLMLSLIKERGWQVMGIEPSNTAAKIAKKKGIKVIARKFEQVRIKNKFDLIMFNHTLEHLEDPYSVLKKAASLLRKGGLIYIDLPNFDSVAAKLLKGKWGLLLPEEHLWHFTQVSLDRLLTKLGFEIIFTKKVSGIFDVDSPFKELLVSGTSLKKRFFTNLMTLIPSFILSSLNQGSGLTIIAKNV